MAVETKASVKDANEFDVCVIGLGYVGLTLAAALADIGMKVLGIERRQDVVDLTNEGKAHFFERGLDAVLAEAVRSKQFQASQSLDAAHRARIWVLTVGTPLDSDGKFQTALISNATSEIADNLEDGNLVILRSTVAIGTTRDVVKSILNETGKDIHIGMCPERTLEGRAMQELRHLPQIVGTETAEAARIASEFFMQMTHTVVRVSSFEAAEIVKLVDNTYRDVQFGFANEVARICDAFGVNAMEVIGGGKLGYPRTNVALPGLVGGPCLEKDPHILAQSMANSGLQLDITTSARRVNERQPKETVEFVAKKLAERADERQGKPVIALLGLAFKGIPATDDLRGSMGLWVLKELEKQIPEFELRLFDPVCDAETLSSLHDTATVSASVSDAVRGADCAIIANNHPEFSKLPPVKLTQLMSDAGFVYDYWNHFSDYRRYEVGSHYYAVGNTGGI